jgi:hypothetical protein
MSVFALIRVCIASEGRTLETVALVIVAERLPGVAHLQKRPVMQNYAICAF